MRSLRRNQKTIYYELYKGKTDVLDENDMYTGEKKPEYDKQKSVRATVSDVGGRIANASYGKKESYDISVIVDDTAIKFTEKTRFWVGNDPKGFHNYEVTQINPTFDHVRIYLTKVRVNG